MHPWVRITGWKGRGARQLGREVKQEQVGPQVGVGGGIRVKTVRHGGKGSWLHRQQVNRYSTKGTRIDGGRRVPFSG